MITHDEVRRLFEYSDGKLLWRVKLNRSIVIGSEAGTLCARGYRRTRIHGKSYLCHRLVWLYHHGYFSENEIDHINRKKHDNRIENLREVSRACNRKNIGTFSNNKCGIRGVCFDKRAKRFKAQIKVDKRSIQIGRFDDIEEAVLARYAAEQCLGWSGCDSDSPARQYALKHGLVKK